MPKTFEVPLASIEVGTDRARDLDPCWAEGLAAIIASQGLMTPILLRPLPGAASNYRLVAGLHRLEAFRLLGRDHIPAQLSEAGTDDEARLQEVMENLGRAELTALDRCHHLYELKQVWLRMHPEAAAGGDRGNQYICAIFYTDRGAGYKNKHFDADAGGLMGRLGITKMHALPYNSQAKGVIERFNAVWNGLARKFPTYIGRDMDKEAKQAVHKETRSEIREIGVARRLPSWEAFIAAVEQTIAEYNDRPHEGLPRFADPETGKQRHMSPNEAWAAHVAAGFMPVTIHPEDEDDLFRPYEFRKARRSQIEWNTNNYFHEALQAYEGEDVMVGYDLHQADKVWVREFDKTTGNPGKLICVAIFNGNAQRYIPLTMEQKALEERQKAALKRLEDKRRSKQAEMDGPWLLEATATEIADFIEVVPMPEQQPVLLAVDNSEVAQSSPPLRRQVFASDAELAAWALANPQELTPNQIAVLKDCLSRSNAREVFRLSGIDTEALRNLLRAAA